MDQSTEKGVHTALNHIRLLANLMTPGVSLSLTHSGRALLPLVDRDLVDLGALGVDLIDRDRHGLAVLRDHSAQVTTTLPDLIMSLLDSYVPTRVTAIVS